MNRLKRTLAGTATVAVSASALTMLAGVGVANAASGTLGNLSVNPSSGVANNATTGRPTFSSAAACPAGTSAYDAVMNGPSGSGWTNIQALGNSPYGGGTLSSQLSDTFAGIAAANSLSSIPAGAYTVTFRCLDSFGSVEPGPATGDAVLTFGAATSGINNPWHTAVATTTSLVASPASAVAGDNVTLTATVTTGAAGTISFTSGSATLGSATVDGIGTGAGHNSGSITVNNLPIGSDAVTATFTATDPTAWLGSAGSTTVTVGQVTPSSTLTINPAGPKYTTTTISFTCTVAGPASGSGSNAGTPQGTVTFTYTAPGASTATTTAPVSLSGGSASYTAGTFAQGTLSASCAYQPVSGGNYAAGSPSAAQSASISGVDPNRVATEYLQTTVNPGALTLTVIGFNAPSPTAKTGTPVADNATSGAYPGQGATPSNVVILPAANLNSAGTYIVTSGDMIPVQAVDTRAGDPGYTVTGQLANLVGTTSSADTINAGNFGWAPSFVSSTRVPSATTAAGAGLVAGPTVAAGPGYAPTATPTAGNDGLSTAKTLFTAPAGAGNGTVVYGARLSMQAPTSTQADTYVGTLTLTAA